MRSLATIPFLLCFGVAAVGADRVVPIIDSSSPGSPLSNVGTAILSEALVDTRMTMQHTEKWTARNISSKPILASVETLRVHYANGSDAEAGFEDDTYFHPVPVMPGEDIEFASGPPIADTRPLTTHDSRPASCEVIVRWVQFVDGTSFGDAAYAEHLFGLRAVILKELKRLHAVYQGDGLEQFSTQLQQRTNNAADGYVGHLRILQSRTGPQAALDALEMHLDTAESRSGLYYKDPFPTGPSCGDVTIPPD